MQNYEELLYCGKPMNPEPKAGFKSIVENVKAGKPTYVELQPGDMTKYELMLIYAPVNDWMYELIAVRLRSGEAVAAAVIYSDSFNIGRAARQLSDDNKWTEQLLAWWLQIFVDHLREVTHL